MSRVEYDALGSLSIADVEYGIHTQRAVENFAIDEERVSLAVIYAMVEIKQAAAIAHRKSKSYDSQKADAIIHACTRILRGEFDAMFITHPLQGGAGTSAHMNVNEVVANVALEELGLAKGSYDAISPLDDVNRCQSTNDVFPTAMRIAAIRSLRSLAKAITSLQAALVEKEHAWSDVVRLGRTQYMDAVPLTMGQTFGAYAAVIQRDWWRLYKAEERLRTINLGGTAIGTGINADRAYVFAITDALQEITGLGLARSENLIDATQNLDAFAEVSGLVKTAALNLMKIANDLRLLSSGPRGGLGELILQPKQAGSSIMPGKVNPVLLESVVQIALQVCGNDTMITHAVGMGVLELNAFGPLIIDAFLKSANRLRAAARMLENVITELNVDQQRCLDHLERSTAMITLLVPILGYATASRIAKRVLAENTTVNAVLLEEKLLSQSEIDRLFTTVSLVSPGIRRRENHE